MVIVNNVGGPATAVESCLPDCFAFLRAPFIILEPKFKAAPQEFSREEKVKLQQAGVDPSVHHTGSVKQRQPKFQAPSKDELADLSVACRAASSQRCALARRVVVVTKWLLPVVARCTVDLMRKGGPKYAVANARRLKKCLEALGPAFVKLGQALAAREDLLSDDVVAELRALCDQVEAFPHEQAQRLVENELSYKAPDLPRNPVAAASLGQVYRIEVDGKYYALKVQRPGLAKALAIDVVILKGIAKVLRCLVKMCCVTRLDPEQVMEDWAKTLWQELDYRKEAESQEHCRTHICPRVKGLVVPQVNWQLTSLRVLATEWIDGCKITQDPRAISTRHIKIGVDTYASMIIEHGLVHADPHAGNMLITQGGDLCLLDYGMVIKVPKEHRKAWASAIVHLVRGNYPEVLESLTVIGIFPRDCAKEVVLPVMSKLWKELVLCGSSTQKRKTAVRTCYSEIMTLVRKFKFDLPDYYVALARALLTLEGIALSADCDFDIFQAAFPVALRALRSAATEGSCVASKALLSATRISCRDLAVFVTSTLIIVAACNANVRNMVGFEMSTFGY